MHVNRARSSVVIDAPYLLEERVAGKRMVGILYEKREESVFQVREVDGFVRNRNLVRIEVYYHVAYRYDMRSNARFGYAEESARAHQTFRLS